MNDLINKEEESAIFQKMFLEEAISRLPENYKVVILLRAHGFTQLEVGKIIGRTKQGTGYLNRRAKKRLREIQKDLESLGEIRNDE